MPNYHDLPEPPDYLDDLPAPGRLSWDDRPSSTFDDLFDDYEPDEPTYSDPRILSRIRAKVFGIPEKIADKIYETKVDLEYDSDRRGKWKHVIGGVALGAIVQVGLLGGAFKVLQSQEETLAETEESPLELVIDEEQEEQHEEGVIEIETEQPEEEPQSDLANKISQLYEDSQAYEQSSPLPAEGEIASSLEIARMYRDGEIDAETKDLMLVESNGARTGLIERHKYEAAFISSVETRSGIAFNIYRSGLGDTSDPFSVDARSLDVLTDLTLEKMSQIENVEWFSPNMPAVRDQGENGEIDLTIDVIINTDGTLCVVEQPLSESEPGVYRGSPDSSNEKALGDTGFDNTNCDAFGYTTREWMADLPQTYQTILITDAWQEAEEWAIENSYEDDSEGRGLQASKFMSSIVFSHELAHAIVGYSGSAGDVSSDVEHSEVVDIAEQMMRDDLEAMFQNRESIDQLAPFDDQD